MREASPTEMASLFIPSAAGARLTPHCAKPLGGIRLAMSTLFLVFRDPGPSWVPGAPSRQQPLWDAHALFMDSLFEARRVVLGGPYADYSRVLVIVEARDAEEASALFRGDPWEKAGILVPSQVIEWTVFLDSRRAAR